MSNRPKRHKAYDKYSALKQYISDFGEIKWKNTVSYITYKRTYARRLDENDSDSKTEEFPQTLFRVIKACNEQLNMNLTPDEQCEYYDMFAKFKALPAGRFLWQLGTNTVEKHGLLSLQNCAFTEVNNIESFCWAFDCLMVGAGVGYNIQKKYVDKLPRPKPITITRDDTRDADFIVPDSREGWVSLLRTALSAHFEDSCPAGKFTYSCVCLRSKGALIKGFGGVASGPDHLCQGIADINKIINSRAMTGSVMRPIDCLDVMNIIARTVISGNVRRCLPEGTLVHTTSGLIPIEDITTDHKIQTPKGEFAITDWMYQGEQDVISVMTSTGMVQCTEKHMMAIWNDENPMKVIWKRAEELTVNDMLINVSHIILGMNTNIKDLKGTPLLTKTAAYFLGYTHGQLKNVKYETVDDSGEEFVSFPCTNLLTLISPEFIRCPLHIRTDYFIIESKEFTNHVRNVSDTGSIPSYIMQALPDIRKSYIDGYNKSANNEKVIEVINRRFLYNIQSLYAATGIYTTADFSSCTLTITTPSFSKSIKNLIYYPTPELTPVKILSICEERNTMRTYDITVDEIEQFVIGDGTLTHNSAQIAIGDHNDIEFLNAKRWDKGNIPNWRCFSNNSVVCSNTSDLPEEFWEGYKGNGECYGLINIDLSRKTGRTGETQYPDPNVSGYNPSLKAGTRVLTSEGIFPIEKLEDKFFKTRNIGGGWSFARCWKSGIDKPLYELKLSNGKSYFCTSEHKWPVIKEDESDQKGRQIIRTLTTEIIPGDKLPYIRGGTFSPVNAVGSYADGFALGLLYASPTKFVIPGEHDRYVWCLPQSKILINKLLISWFNSIDHAAIRTVEEQDRFGNKFNMFTPQSKSFNSYMKQFGITSHSHVSSGTYGAPDIVWVGTDDLRRGFIDAMYTMKGDVNEQFGKIHCLSETFAVDFWDILGFYGVQGRIEIVDDNITKDKVYVVVFELDMFSQLFATSDADKQQMLDSIQHNTYNTIGDISVISCELSKEVGDVWDVAVYDSTHTFALSHCFTGNCGEQSLVNRETCCLQELFLPNIDSQEELIKCAKAMYRIAKHSMAIPCHQKATESIVHKNMRMGIGITGILQAPEKIKWLDQTYKQLREFDVAYSAQHSLPTSIKLTTVKPSGCVDPSTTILVKEDENIEAKTLGQLFEEQGITNKHEGQKWFDLKKQIQVFDENNNAQNVIKLYDNGIQETVILEIDDEELICTLDHKFKTIRDGHEVWVPAIQLVEGDKIKSY
jgi:hypothetical protein